MKKILLLMAIMISPVHAEIYDIADFSLDSYRGKVIYLDFWASWCKPCRVSFPWMNGLKTRFPEKDFQVVTINLDASSEAMHRFLEKNDANFDIYHDGSGKLAETFKLEGMPTSFLIDRNGQVVSRHVGFYESRQDEKTREIESLL